MASYIEPDFFIKYSRILSGKTLQSPIIAELWQLIAWNIEWKHQNFSITLKEKNNSEYEYDIKNLCNEITRLKGTYEIECDTYRASNGNKYERCTINMHFPYIDNEYYGFSDDDSEEYE